MKSVSVDAVAGVRGFLIAVGLVMLAGCSSTITNSANLSGASPIQWKDYAHLPVDLHGSVSGMPQSELAALISPSSQSIISGADSSLDADPARRIVVFVNPPASVSAQDLCNATVSMAPNEFGGRLTPVTAVLCDHSTPIARADGNILLKDQTPASARHDLHLVTTQLYYSLFPYAHDPMRYYE